MPYPPSGGGISHPRMEPDRRLGLQGAREYGEWPPSSMLSGTRRRTIRGYNEHVFGEPPENARSSSTPRRGDIGYTVLEDYPAGSRMGREYSDYKSKQRDYDVASRDYRQQGPILRAPKDIRERDGRAYGPVKGDLFYPEDHATMAPLARRVRETSDTHAQARTEFHKAHRARIPNFSGHRQQESQAYRSAKRYEKYEGQHIHYSTMDRYPNGHH